MKKTRALGQNFLVDPNVAEQILSAASIEPEDTVVEIGPGHGAITEGLLELAGRVIALEIDPKLCHSLTRRWGKKEKFRLIQGDALKFDFSSLGSNLKIVSNLPYSTATPIVKRLVHYRKHIRDMTVMLQKEVAQRLVAVPNQKEYGSLSVYLQYHCHAEPLFDVDPDCFSPPPKVESSVIRITPLADPAVQVEQEATFFKVVNAAFFHKRKMLKNNLGRWKDRFRQEHDKILLGNIDLSRRGEMLTLEEFADIANTISAKHE